MARAKRPEAEFDEEKIAVRPWQANIIAGEKQIIATVGAKGVAKTWALTRFVGNEVLLQPKSRGILMWNTLKQANQIYEEHLEPFFQKMGYPYRFNQQRLQIKLFGDTTIVLASAEPGPIESIESVSFDWGAADECSFYTPEALKTFTSRIRKRLARRRYFSMPTEPDAFMYSFFEGLKCDDGTDAILYELGLNDNPDWRFRERYRTILRSIYTGEELKRFEDGLRVTLAGKGCFALTSSHKKVSLINPEGALWIGWDFNVEYKAVSIWSEQGKRPDDQLPLLACIASWKMNGHELKRDAEEVCRKIKELWPHHKGDIMLTGDASGAARHVSSPDSSWTIVMRAFREAFGPRMRPRYPKANPPVSDRIECCNWALNRGVIWFDPAEKFTFNSFAACKYDKHGGIDKSIDNMEGGAKTHFADSGGYVVYPVYQNLYLRY